MLVRPAISIIMYKKRKRSLRIKSDVGMACQKVHKQRREVTKVKVNKQSLIHPYPKPYIFSWYSEDVGTRALYIFYSRICMVLCMSHNNVTLQIEMCLVSCDYVTTHSHVWYSNLTLLSWGSSYLVELLWGQRVLGRRYHCTQHWKSNEKQQSQCLEISSNCTAMVTNTVLQWNPT